MQRLNCPRKPTWRRTSNRSTLMLPWRMPGKTTIYCSMKIYSLTRTIATTKRIHWLRRFRCPLPLPCYLYLPKTPPLSRQITALMKTISYPLPPPTPLPRNKHCNSLPLLQPRFMNLRLYLRASFGYSTVSLRNASSNRFANWSLLNPLHLYFTDLLRHTKTYARSQTRNNIQVGLDMQSFGANPSYQFDAEEEQIS